MQDIKVTITGSQIEDGEENITELITEGHLMRDGDLTVIEYDESAVYGIENSKTSLKIAGNSIHMVKYGDFATEFVFTPAQTYEAMYYTPFGMLQVDVFPIKVSSAETESGGSLDLEYEIKIGDVRTHNRMNVVYEFKN